jgi:hypothetical protein
MFPLVACLELVGYVSSVHKDRLASEVSRLEQEIQFLQGHPSYTSTNEENDFTSPKFTLSQTAVLPQPPPEEDSVHNTCKAATDIGIDATVEISPTLATPKPSAIVSNTPSEPSKESGASFPGEEASGGASSDSKVGKTKNSKESALDECIMDGGAMKGMGASHEAEQQADIAEKKEQGELRDNEVGQQESSQEHGYGLVEQAIRLSKPQDQHTQTDCQKEPMLLDALQRQAQTTAAEVQASATP